MPRSEQQDSNSNSQQQQSGSQTGSEYSIDLDKIVPPTFRFGQYGQAPLPSDPVTVEEAKAESDYNSPPADNGNFDDISFDDDSFLAEPSITVDQFDATFNLQANKSVESVKSEYETGSVKSTPSVPILIEEPLQTPTYLEEPAAHTVEELLKATIDGDTAAVMAESWENVGIEEIEADQAEFAKNQEVEPETEIAGVEHELIEPVEDVENLKTVEDVDDLLEAPVEVVESVENISKPVTETVEEAVEPKAKKPVAVKKEAAVKKAAVVKKPTVVKKAEVVKKPVASKKTEDTPVPEGTTGKRERRTVERLADTIAPPVKKVVEKIPTIPKGSGVKLADIELILQKIDKKPSSDESIIGLHRLLFDRMGEARHRKASLRAWCGQDDAKFDSKLQKYTKIELVEMCGFLGLTSANEKPVIIEKISSFLVKPSREAVKFTVKGERITKVPSAAAKKKAALEAAKPKATRSSKRKAEEPATKIRKPYTKTAKKSEFLTPEIVDSDTETEES